MDFQLASRNGFVKAESGSGDRPGGKLEQCRDLRIHGDFKSLSRTRPATDCPLILGSSAKARDPLYGAKELDERSEVVRAHIEQGPSTFLEKKLWIWMPGIGAWIAKRGLGRDRGAYAAGLDHPACRLQARTQEGVGSIAQVDFVSRQRPPMIVCASSIDNANGFSP